MEKLNEVFKNANSVEELKAVALLSGVKHKAKEIKDNLKNIVDEKEREEVAEMVQIAENLLKNNHLDYKAKVEIMVDNMID